MTKTERIWLAGFFDGEGCVSTTKHKSVCITIGQKFSGVLHHIKNILKYGNIGSTLGLFQIRIYGKSNCKKFIQAILPYSIVKKNQLRVAMKIINLTNLQGAHLAKEERIQKQLLSKELKKLKRRESVKLQSSQSRQQGFN